MRKPVVPAPPTTKTILTAAILTVEMQLSVPLIRQPRGSMECGLACLCMLLRYHSLPTSLAELRRALPVHSHGLFTGEVGCALLERGFAVRIVLMQPRLFTLADDTLGSTILRRRLAKFAANRRATIRDREAATHLVRFMDAGGSLEIRVPSPKDIAAELRARRPVIASLTAHFLSAPRPAFTFHYTVVTGMSETTVRCNDPAWNSTGGRRVHDMEAFFFGIAATAHHQLDEPCLILAQPPSASRKGAI